jgi:hypothetical protein
MGDVDVMNGGGAIPIGGIGGNGNTVPSAGGSFSQLTGGAMVTMKAALIGAAVAIFAWFAFSYRDQAMRANARLKYLGYEQEPMMTLADGINKPLTYMRGMGSASAPSSTNSSNNTPALPPPAPTPTTAPTNGTPTTA